MNKRSIAIPTLLALLGVVLVLAGCSTAATQLGEEERTISVSGSGTVSVVPDEVVLRLGVETTAETASEALSQNSEQMEAVIEGLKGAGIPAENIQTQTVQLRPRYETPQREPGEVEERELIGYTASNIVEARTEDLDAVGQLLDAAVEAGANRIDGVRFEVSDPSELLSQAREDAWEDAQNKAQQLATLAEDELGEVLSISESTSAPQPLGLGGGVEREAAVPIEPGSENIRVDLRVTWSLR